MDALPKEPLQGKTPQKEKLQVNPSLKKRARLVDIAQAVGVSRWTVGQVLNGGQGNSRVSPETAQKIKTAAAELQYKPSHAAITLRSNRSKVFGVMVSSVGDPLRSFLVQYLDSEAVRHGRRVLLANTVGNVPFAKDQFDNVLDTFASHQVDGVFCALHNWFPGDRQKLLSYFPLTIFYEDRIPGAPSVFVDRGAAVRIAVDHLAQKGRKRIALAIESMTTPHGRQRFLEWTNRLKFHQLPAGEDLFFSAELHGALHVKHHDQGRYWMFPFEAMEPVIQHLVIEGKADALVVQNDFWAAAIIKSLRKKKIRVPDDVAIIGFLNHYLADWTDPALTTIDLNHHQAAKVMFEMMGQLIDKKNCEKEVFIEPRLIQREST